MTKRELIDYNKMRDALIEITKYMTVDQIVKKSEKLYALSWEEALGMSYDNIKATAKNAVKGVRAAKYKEGKND